MKPRNHNSDATVEAVIGGSQARSTTYPVALALN